MAGSRPSQSFAAARRSDEANVSDVPESSQKLDLQEPFSLNIRARSITGPVRRNNQDSAYASPTMLLVADGMGGAAAGDLASSVAVTELSKIDARLSFPQAAEILAGAISQANDKLADLVAWDSRLDGMGTTVCGAIFSDNKLQLVHIGDSRAYLLRNDELTQLTHDDSWVQSLVDQGKLTEKQAAVHPHRSLLLKVLNGQPGQDPDFPVTELQLGDRLLFCSDGLCGLVAKPDLAELLATSDLDEAAEKLVSAAISAGGYDNITLVICEVVPHNTELDQASAQILGAATQVRIPRVAPAHLPGDNSPTSTTAAVSQADSPVSVPATAIEEPSVRKPNLFAGHDISEGETIVFPKVADAEAAGPDVNDYESTIRRRRKWPIVVSILLVIAIITAGAYTWFRYANSHYFIGENNNQVSIYRGVPGHLAGIDLASLQEQHNTKVSDLPSYYAQQVETNSITTNSLDEAREKTDFLDKAAAQCAISRANATQAADGPSPEATASPAASTPTDASAATMTGGC